MKLWNILECILLEIVVILLCISHGAMRRQLLSSVTKKGQGVLHGDISPSEPMSRLQRR